MITYEDKLRADRPLRLALEGLGAEGGLDRVAGRRGDRFLDSEESASLLRPDVGLQSAGGLRAAREDFHALLLLAVRLPDGRVGRLPEHQHGTPTPSSSAPACAGPTRTSSTCWARCRFGRERAAQGRRAPGAGLMRARVTTVFACQGCGAASPKWLGRCPDCGEWNSYVEEARGEARPAPVGAPAAPIAQVGLESGERTSTSLPGLDRVLGGGLVPGSLVLLGGEPGIGKSTLLLQASRGVARSGDVLYATGEESAGQVRLRGERLGVAEETPAWSRGDRSVGHRGCGGGRAPSLLVVDSIQAVRAAALLLRGRHGLPGARGGPAASALRQVVGNARDPDRARHQGREPRRPEVARAPGRRGDLDRRRARRLAPHPARHQEPLRPRRRARALRDDGGRPVRDRQRVGGAAVRAAGRAARQSCDRGARGDPIPARRGAGPRRSGDVRARPAASRSVSTARGWRCCSPFWREEGCRSRPGRSSSPAPEASRWGSPRPISRSWRPSPRPCDPPRCPSAPCSSARSGCSGRSGGCRPPRRG